ncbi:MAG: hypothetical protein KGI25_07650 [Thaumarchaeota archaeon]|nr:hypothetical protein [Nitrososphaerota archaeon]
MNEDNTMNNKEHLVEKNQNALYTQEQRDSFVRGFIEAWRTHRVYPDHTRFSNKPSPSPFYLGDLPSPSKSPLTVATVSSASELRNLIENKIKIASGSIHSPPELVQETINGLYNDIIDMEGRHYLAGSFLDSEVEDRIFERLRKTLDQHIEKIRNELGLDER